MISFGGMAKLAHALFCSKVGFPPRGCTHAH